MTNSSDTTGLSETLLELLRTNNPFISGAAAEPWSKSFPDIASINRRAFEDILNLIQSKVDYPRVPLAGIVRGEAGEGKTHLLRRILLACKKANPPSLFVFVRPWFDATQPFRHLLQEIVLCLAEKNEGQDDFSQFDRLVAEIIRDYVHYRVRGNPTPANTAFLEQFETDVFYFYKNEVNAKAMAIIERDAVDYVHRQSPRTRREFLEVIFQYKDSEKRGLVVEWLQGSDLDDVDCQRLGVHSREKDSDETKEQHARDMIMTLGLLFTQYRLPMVICFDQIDSFTQSAEVIGFGKMIDLLVNHTWNILPLAFVRDDTWNSLFKEHLPSATRERLITNVLELSSATQEESQQLVSRRIEHVFGESADETNTIKEWLLPLLKKRLQASAYNSPREVIRVANSIIRGAGIIRDGSELSTESPNPNETLDAEYKAAYESVATDFSKWIPDSEYLKEAAKLFLTHQESVQSCTPGEDKYTSWTGTLINSEGNEIPYVCFINKSGHHFSVLNTLTRAKEFLQKHPHGVCTYVTDARHDFKSTWTTTNERRQEVEKQGGNIVILDQSQVVRWYGLLSLTGKISGGDISIGMRTATTEDLENFLRSGFSTYATEGLFDQLLTPLKIVPSSEPESVPPVYQFVDAAKNCLAQCSWPVLATDMLTNKLREEGFEVAHEWCLEQLGKNQHIFNLLQSRDGFIVKLVK